MLDGLPKYAGPVRALKGVGGGSGKPSHLARSALRPRTAAPATRRHRRRAVATGGALQPGDTLTPPLPPPRCSLFPRLTPPPPPPPRSRSFTALAVSRDLLAPEPGKLRLGGHLVPETDEAGTAEELAEAGAGGDR